MKIVNYDEIKKDKIIVKTWDDLEGENKLLIEKENGFITVGYCMITIKTFNSINGLKKAVKILNALGGNFEYAEVEVIDTFPKFNIFLIKERISYIPQNKTYIFFELDMANGLSIKDVEQKFNVDLKILKDKNE